MKLELATQLRCSQCGTDSLEAQVFEASGADRIESGILRCGQCGAWYPVSGHIADLLPGGLAEGRARAEFYEQHRQRLEELGLSPPVNRQDPGFEAQEHQREHFDDLARREDRFSYDALG